jgi:hypothetical protein
MRREHKDSLSPITAKKLRRYRTNILDCGWFRALAALGLRRYHGPRFKAGGVVSTISRIGSPTAVFAASACHSIAISVHATLVAASGAVLADASAHNALARYLSVSLGTSRLHVAGAQYSQSPIARFGRRFQIVHVQREGVEPNQRVTPPQLGKRRTVKLNGEAAADGAAVEPSLAR